MKTKFKLNRYTLQLITGGTENGLFITYEEAHGFYIDCECYYFYIYDDKNGKTVISIYPVNRTIISKISEL